MDGSYIRELRRRLGITQRELGDRLDVEQGTVSRWERGIESPRPWRLKLLRDMALKHEARRHRDRSLAKIRQDMLAANLIDENLRMVEMSASAADHFRIRDWDPSKMIGMGFYERMESMQTPYLAETFTESGLVRGEALLFRFTMNVRGMGHTTVYEPIFEGGEFGGFIAFVTDRMTFSANQERSMERVDFVPADDPTKLVNLHRGARYDEIANS